MKFALVEAKRLGFDVFNALDIMDNVEFLDELKFSAGDGSLHYYFYNWTVSSRLTPQQVGIVLVWSWVPACIVYSTARREDDLIQTGRDWLK